ncbi:hypothetical protein GA0061098_106011 [Bradyrhizobium shewense]|uniref:Asp/Glu/hydantoin racemase n=1 Tax=Bradyrhizobium shewense TaxID=1761772 RepID=A0A1C3XUG2_9BRAD|nr:hypothetical protein [Bradyrhizobium shewense]SCB55913.1 hypothetical protein GA0061098_106011 [Bradyrhizobium shewense]
MESQPSPALGILRLEFGRPPTDPVPGGYMDSTWIGMPVISETAEGAWTERVVHGDPALADAYVAAARRLVDRGAVAICSDCGFTLRYQTAVASAVNVPVAMSSLLLIPTLLRQLPKSTKLAILTANASQLSEDLLVVRDPGDLSRLVIGGIEDSEVWRMWVERPIRPASDELLTNAVIACVERLRVEHSQIGAFLFECTSFLRTAPAVRRITNLPLYGIDTITRMAAASVLRT